MSKSIPMTLERACALKEEIDSSKNAAFNDGAKFAERIFIELLAGASIEELDTDDDLCLELAKKLKPIIDRVRSK